MYNITLQPRVWLTVQSPKTTFDKAYIVILIFCYWNCTDKKEDNVWNTWSRDGLCFAARVDWRKVNTRFIPDAFQTLRFFCSGQDIKAIKAVWNTINQNSFSHPILVSRLLLRTGVAMTVFKVTSDLDKDILDIT